MRFSPEKPFLVPFWWKYSPILLYKIKSGAICNGQLNEAEFIYIQNLVVGLRLQFSSTSLPKSQGFIVGFIPSWALRHIATCKCSLLTFYVNASVVGGNAASWWQPFPAIRCCHIFVLHLVIVLQSKKVCPYAVLINARPLHSKDQN